MYHRMGGRKFGLPSDQRRALLKSLVRALFTYQTIKTTETRAKDVRGIAEKLITDARVDTLHARRQARKYLNDETLVHHLFTQIAPEFKTTPGGYTRSVKIGPRRGDAATIVQLSLVTDRELPVPTAPDKTGQPQRGARSPRMLARTLKLTVEYDGTDFCGYQTQGQGERTVQSVLAEAVQDHYAAGRGYA